MKYRGPWGSEFPAQIFTIGKVTLNSDGQDSRNGHFEFWPKNDFIFEPSFNNDALYFSQNIFWVKRHPQCKNEENQSCGKWLSYEVLL